MQPSLVSRHRCKVKKHFQVKSHGERLLWVTATSSWRLWLDIVLFLTSNKWPMTWLVFCSLLSVQTMRHCTRVCIHFILVTFLELDEVDVSCIFCWQPINYINDQENMDVNESYTDPQPTCSMPRKTLPGRTYILGNPARPPATFLLHASYNVVSTFLLQWFLPWTTLLCLIPKSTPCPRCLLFTEFIFKTFVVFSSM